MIVGRLVACVLPFIFLSTSTSTLGTEHEDEGNFLSSPDNFVYPEYCSKNIESRHIPPLSFDESGSSKLELLQVHVVVRHGARTPAGLSSCWKDYHPKWDCEYHEALKGRNSIVLLKDSNRKRYLRNNPDSTTFLFEKIFDVEPNILGGTCQEGQLIEEGVTQHQVLGRLLADAYLNSSNSNRLVLSGSRPLLTAEDNLNSAIYFRCTDMQRTRLSGANLLTSLLTAGGIETAGRQPIKLHTVDLEKEYLFENSVACPSLTRIRRDISNSQEYKDMMIRHMPTINKVEDALGNPFPIGLWPNRVLDCLMTSICTDRWNDIPDPLRPNGNFPSDSADFIAEVTSRIEEEAAMLHLYGNSIYSKISIGRFMTDIRNQIITTVMKRSKNYLSQSLKAAFKEDSATEVPKFILWSGHDTTVMPFIASFGPEVWDGKWPPYAAMVVIEIYEASTEATPASSFFFRLVYDGKVLTSGIPGCHSGANHATDELCEVTTFLESTQWVSNSVTDCTNSDQEITYITSSAPASNVGGRSAWSIVVHDLFCIIIGMVIGSVAWHIIGRYWHSRRKSYLQNNLLSDKEYVAMGESLVAQATFCNRSRVD